MKIKVTKRVGTKKSELSQIRHKGDVPAVLYGKESHLISLDGAEFHAVMRTMKTGHLPTTVFELEGDGVKCRAIVKDIQYHPVTYNVLHLDLLEVDGKPVKVNVPVECLGEADCVGIKLGGALRQVIRHVKALCEPQNIPTSFQLNIAQMAIKQSKRVGDIKVPEGVTILAGLKDVVVTIAKR